MDAGVLLLVRTLTFYYLLLFESAMTIYYHALRHIWHTTSPTYLLTILHLPTTYPIQHPLTCLKLKYHTPYPTPTYLLHALLHPLAYSNVSRCCCFICVRNADHTAGWNQVTQVLCCTKVRVGLIMNTHPNMIIHPRTHLVTHLLTQSIFFHLLFTPSNPLLHLLPRILPHPLTHL